MTGKGWVAILLAGGGAVLTLVGGLLMGKEKDANSVDAMTKGLKDAISQEVSSQMADYAKNVPIGTNVGG